jgi:hypothetical protein
MSKRNFYFEREGVCFSGMWLGMDVRMHTQREIGLGAQIMVTIIGSIINKIHPGRGGTYMTNQLHQ